MYVGVWIVVFIFCILIERKSKDILAVYFSISAILSLITSFFTKYLDIQVIVFIISSIVFIIFFKTIIDKIIEVELKFKKRTIGSKVIVLKQHKIDGFYYVLTKKGIYKGKVIGEKNNIAKYDICKIIYNDGNILLIAP